MVFLLTLSVPMGPLPSERRLGPRNLHCLLDIFAIDEKMSSAAGMDFAEV
jgi:hypothetical protein